MVEERIYTLIGRQAARIQELEQYHTNAAGENARLLSLFDKIARMEGDDDIDDHKFAKTVLEEIIPEALHE